MHDYIIVGAGSSGCVLTRRLIDAGKKVLIIESGSLKKETSNIENVEGFPNLWGSSYDWNYATVPQKGLSERVININQGKVVGGSGSINAMMYVRGNKNDYEQLYERGGEIWSLKGPEPGLGSAIITLLANNYALVPQIMCPNGALGGQLVVQM